MMNKEEKYTILLAEDNYGDVMLIQQAINSVGLPYDLTVANDGEEALNLLLNNSEEERIKPDLILLDINMPRLDGKEVLKAVKNNPDIKTTPVIVLTSSKSEKDIRDMYELYANSYVVKPIGLDELNKLVEVIAAYWFGTVHRPSKIK